MKKLLVWSSCVLSAIAVLAACSAYRMPKNLTPDQKEFYSKVRYIITKQERAVFKNLPPSEREGFIQEFWKRRDTDPETEENEYREEYFKRIEDANHLFREGGTPGWLQDRGRIYILLGPPDDRYKYPTGYSFYDRPSELWFYGVFPIIFVDQSYTQDYEISPLSAQYLAVLLRAQMNLKHEVKMEGVALDFGLKLEKFPGNRVEVRIEVPFHKVWMKERGDRLETTLRLSLEALAGTTRVWAYDEDYPVSLSQDEIKDALGGDLPITVSAVLPPGKYAMRVRLENVTDGQKVEKTITFKL